MTCRVVFISWELHPSGFLKVNFDGCVKNTRGGIGFVIQGPDARLLAAGESSLIEIFVLCHELQIAWAGILCAS